jgi:hypothetical protein
MDLIEIRKLLIQKKKKEGVTQVDNLGLSQAT